MSRYNWTRRLRVRGIIRTEYDKRETNCKRIISNILRFSKLFVVLGEEKEIFCGSLIGFMESGLDVSPEKCFAAV
jgi:hypothetical protein